MAIVLIHVQPCDAGVVDLAHIALAIDHVEVSRHPVVPVSHVIPEQRVGVIGDTKIEGRVPRMHRCEVDGDAGYLGRGGGVALGHAIPSTPMRPVVHEMPHRQKGYARVIQDLPLGIVLRPNSEPCRHEVEADDELLIALGDVVFHQGDVERVAGDAGGHRHRDRAVVRVSCTSDLRCDVHTHQGAAVEQVNAEGLLG